jgi:ornithine decarboxylase
MDNTAVEFQTPSLVFSLSKVESNYLALKRASGDREILFSLKACHHVEVIEKLVSLGAGFDIASSGELDLIKKYNLDREKIFFSSTVKIPRHIVYAYDYGVRYFAFDSYAEADAIQEYAPNSSVYLRIRVDNTGSEWPLTRKFGIDPSQAGLLLYYAKKAGLNPVGITFHVGSQCLDISNWSKALQQTADIFSEAEANSIKLSIINLGGGFPVQYQEAEIPSIEKIGSEINGQINRLFTNDIRVILEPGRYMVGNAGVLVATVINTSEREGKKWVYLDVGIYNGLFEASETINYIIKTDHEDRPKEEIILAGPSCDSTDIIYNNHLMLPQLKVGDRIYFLNAGAYTTSYVDYNGLTYPRLILR